MKDLVAAAAMMAEGSPDQSNKQKSSDDDNKRNAAKKPIEAEEVPSNSTATSSASSSDGDKPLKKKDVSVARARRLEQNRRAAAESRRRKKVMIEELQRSVTFYTKANQNLLMDNTELEQRLYLAKRSLGMNVEGQQLKSPPEESNQVAEGTNAAMSTSYEQLINIDLQLHQQLKPGASPTAGAIPFPHLHNSISPIEQLNQGTQATSTALFGYNAFSQLSGTSNVPNEALNLADHLDTKQASVMQTFPLPSKEEVGSIKHIKSLEKFAIQQAATANAAAAAANAAIQELNWHKMMKAKKTDSVPSASVSLESMTATTQPPSSKEEEEPPIKKQKS